MIHEAGAVAVAKAHNRSPHRIRSEGVELFTSKVRDATFTTEGGNFFDRLNNQEFLDALHTSRTAILLDVPLIWDVIEAMAQFIQDNDEGEGLLWRARARMSTS